MAYSIKLLLAFLFMVVCLFSSPSVVRTYSDASIRLTIAPKTAHASSWDSDTGSVPDRSIYPQNNGGGNNSGGNNGGGNNSGGNNGGGNNGGGNNGSNPVSNIVNTIIANITSFLNLRVFLPHKLFVSTVSATVDVLFSGMATQLSSGITTIVRHFNLGKLPVAATGILSSVFSAVLEASKGAAMFVMIISMMLLGLSALIFYMGGSSAGVAHLPKAALFWTFVLIFAMNGDTIVFKINEAVNHLAGEICKATVATCVDANSFATMVVPSARDGSIFYIVGIIGATFTMIMLMLALVGLNISALITAAISPLAISSISLPAGRAIFSAWLNMYGRLVFAYLFTFFVYAALGKITGSNENALLRMLAPAAASALVSTVIVSTLRDNLFHFIPTMTSSITQAFNENVAAVTTMIQSAGGAAITGLGNAISTSVNTVGAIFPTNQSYTASPLSQIPTSAFAQSAITAPLYPAASSLSNRGTGGGAGNVGGINGSAGNGGQGRSGGNAGMAGNSGAPTNGGGGGAPQLGGGGAPPSPSGNVGGPLLPPAPSSGNGGNTGAAKTRFGRMIGQSSSQEDSLR